MRILLALLIFAAPSIAEACSRCGNFRSCQFVQKVQKVVVQDQIVQPIVKQNIFYSVGQDLRYALAYPAINVATQGQITREMQRLQDRLSDLLEQQQRYAQPQMPYGYAPQPQYAPQQYPQPQAAQCPTCPQQPPNQQPPQQPGQPQAPTPPAEPNNPDGTFSQRMPPALNQCAQCHSGLTPKGGFDITQGRSLPWDQRVAAMQKAASGEMPPPDQGDALDDAHLGALARELFSGEEWQRLNQ